MSILTTSYDPNSGIYSYKKDGTWFFSTCPPDQVASRRVDGKWYFVELCVGGGGGGDVTKLYVDQQDNKLQGNIDQSFSDSKDYADSLVADYALISYVDEQIAGIEIPEDQDLSLYAKTTDVEAGDASTLGDAKSYTDEQIAEIEIPEAGDGWDGGRIQFTADSAEEVCLYGSDDIPYISFVPNSTGDYSSNVRLVVKDNHVLVTGCPLDIGGQRVINVGKPSQPTDAVNQQTAKTWDYENLQTAKNYTDEQIGGLDISVDLSDYASQEWVLDQSYITEQPVTDGDAATLQSAKDYTDEQIAAIEFPEGVDLSKYAETTYVDSSIQTVTTETDQKLLTYLPKSGGGVTGTISMGTNKITNLGNATSNKDAVNLEKLNEGLSGKVGNTGTQDLPTSTWKIRARKTSDDGNYSYIAIESDKLKLYHVADPTSDEHALSRGYGDGRYQIRQVPIVFKCDQYVAAVSNQNTPPSGSFCGLNNSDPGSSTNANLYFGNFNADIRVHIDKLKNPDGQVFEKGERYVLNGTVTIFDKAGKLYFKHGITSVSRDNNDYVNLHFCSRIPAFGTGSVSDSSQYVLIVEGLTDKKVDTTNLPEEG